MLDKNLSVYLDALTIWAENKGYYVCFEKNGDDYICPISKIIEINSSASLRQQVYCLLHECGHVLIFDNGSFWDYNSKPRYLYNVQPSKHSDKVIKERYRVYTILEEAEAWKRSFNLAERLGIPICKNEWEKEMLDAMGQYLDWAAS